MVFASSFQGIVCKSRGSQPIIPKIWYVRGIGSFELKIKYFDHPTNFDLPTTPISKLSRNFTKLENRSLSFHSKLDVSALQNLRNSKARKFCPRRYPKSPRSLSNSNARRRYVSSKLTLMSKISSFTQSHHGGFSFQLVNFECMVLVARTADLNVFRRVLNRETCSIRTCP